jgi:sensor histidine kinase YesM
MAACVPLSGLLAAMLRLTPGASWPGSLAVAIPAAVLYAFVCLATRYPARGLPPGRVPPSQLLTAHLTGALFATALWLGILRLWVEVLAHFDSLEGLVTTFRGQVPLLAGVGILLYLLAVTIHSMLHAIERSREAERRALELGLLARESELTLLRSQVDPHFLFNALNSIAGLTHSDPDVARELCLRLGGFLRTGLRIGRQERIPFAEEMALARDFLGIEQVRFGARLRYDEQIEEGCMERLVPPLILQPLLENAVRHGIAGLVDGGDVRLQARTAGSALVIGIENARDPDVPPRRGEGMGLTNVRRRLDAMYGDLGSILLREAPDRFRVEVTIPDRVPGEVDA